ncbi:DUF4304 domain-containing protein [Ensifer sp. ENS12]|uniref:DUF4304 domain-containing protein n=1 Tax=unclassified Ensifer TaxID=2633371 RepID=UPI000DD7A292|nr:DUF4304 domain-containing protein [Ensifer sp. ENS12]
MPVANPVADAVSSLLKPLGFRRKSSSWYLENDETVLIVNVQRSQFGPQYYLNFSVVIRAISTVPQPKEYHGDTASGSKRLCPPTRANCARSC